MDLEDNNEPESLNQPVGVFSKLVTDLSIAGSPNMPQGDKLVRRRCSDKQNYESGIERLHEKDAGLRTLSSVINNLSWKSLQLQFNFGPVQNFGHSENGFLLLRFKLRYVLRHDRVLLCRRFCGP